MTKLTAGIASLNHAQSLKKFASLTEDPPRGDDRVLRFSPVPSFFLALALLDLPGKATSPASSITELNKAFPDGSRASSASSIDPGQRGRMSVIGPLPRQGPRSRSSACRGQRSTSSTRPNRSFLHGKLIAVTLLVGLARHLLRRAAEMLDRSAGSVETLRRQLLPPTTGWPAESRS